MSINQSTKQFSIRVLILLPYKLSSSQIKMRLLYKKINTTIPCNSDQIDEISRKHNT